MPSAAIYTRISNDDEGRSLGVARQLEDCRKLAEREGLAVVEVYSDNDISASTRSRKPRPGYEQMLEDASARRFGVILAYSTSRLTRRPREIEDIIDLNVDFGTRLITVASGSPDLSTADGRLNTRLLGNVDTGEAERTAERGRRKQHELAVAGRHNGPRPFGWRIEGVRADQRLIIDAAEAAVLRECVARALAGEGIWKICLDLNARGIMTSTGREWQTQVLRRVLLRWSNCGMRSHQPLSKEGKAKGNAAIYPGQWEPIIDRETHDRITALLTDPARRSNNRGTAPRYLLTSIARCGECGGYVSGTAEFIYTLANGRTRRYPHTYKCPHPGCMKITRTMVPVDEQVRVLAVSLLTRDGVRLLGGDPIVAEQARERIAALEAKLAIAADQFADDTLTGDQLQRITARLRPQLEAAHARLRQAAPPDESLRKFTGEGAERAWATADVETRKRLIRLLGLSITILRVGAGNGREYDPNSVRIEPMTVHP